MKIMFRSLHCIDGLSLQNDLKHKRCYYLRIPTRVVFLSLCLISASIQYVGLTCGMFIRDAVEMPCPDSAAGLYIRTRADQVVKVFFLILEIPVMQDTASDDA
jgi:hypothetical protein